MATTSVPFWELYSSDLRPSKMVIKRELPPMRFDIPIVSQPPKYRPGNAPPPRVDLRPVHDTNAFIIDKIVLPLEPFTQRKDPRQRRVYYIIGWPDLPAARPVIDATRILDYVSPRTLEDWEYQDALRREAAREAEDRAKESGKPVSVVVADAGTKLGVKRKPGRPPRARMMDAPPPEPILDSDQEELLQRRKSGPSLSTPQKSRLAQLVAEEEILEHLDVVDEDDSLSVVQRQTEAEVSSRDDMDIDADDNLEDSGGVDWLQSNPAASVGEMSCASSPHPSLARNSPMRPANSLARTAAAAAATTHPSPRPASSRQHTKSSTSLSPSRLKSPNVRPISNTPIPLPSYISQSKNQKASTTKPKPEAKPQPKRVVHPIETSTSKGHGQSASPTSQHPETYGLMGRRSSSSLHPSPSRGNGFTPIGGTFPRPPKRPADDIHFAADTPASTQPKKERKKKQPKLSQPDLDSRVNTEVPGTTQAAVDLVTGEKDYVVKRLEGDKVLDGIHWFEVRWEGDWPPGQNPTWEPKENISAKLVKDYLKRKAKRDAERSSKKKTPDPRASGTRKSKDKRQSSLAEWARGYNSVSEAFEGKAELDATTDEMLGRLEIGEAGDDEGEGHEELFVVER